MLIGAGNMGGALLRRWQAAGHDPVVVDPRLGGVLPPDGSPETLVLAVKPQVWQDVVAPFADRVAAGALVVSVMAGVSLAALAARFPGADVVRAMPNTPAAVGRGVTGLFAAAATDPAVRPPPTPCSPRWGRRSGWVTKPSSTP